MEHLPQSSHLSRRDVFDMLILNGMEAVTRSLRKGDGHDLTCLRPLANRCRALADAFDAREREIVNDD